MRKVYYLLCITLCMCFSSLSYSQKRKTIDRTVTQSKQKNTASTSSGDAKKQNQTQKKPSQFFFSISSQSASFGSEGGTKTFTVSSSGSWQISTNTASWGHLTRSGKTLTLRVDSNTETFSRKDYFIIKSGTKSIQVDITQSKAVTLNVSSESLSFTSAGGTQTITISTDGVWSIGTSTTSWGHLSKNGNLLSVKIDPNNSTYSRSDWFTIKSGNKEKRITISQAGSSVSPYLNISKTSLSFFSNGGSETITISSNKEWKIKTGTYSWGHLYRNGNSLVVSVDANNTTQERTDYFVIQAGAIEKRVYISQTGRSSYTSSYNSGYNSHYNYNTYHKESWWKGRVKCGWNITVFDINSEHLSWKTGLRIRFGKHSDWFNFILGCDYSLQMMYIRGESKYISYGTNNYSYYSYYNPGYWSYSSDEWKTLHHEIFIPMELRLNFAQCGSSARWYFGMGFDLGLKISDGDLPSNSTSYACDVLLGVMWKNFDFGINGRFYLENPSIKNDNTSRFGLYGTWYF